MKVTFIASACIEIEYTDGYRIVCDPWLTDGIFYGNWNHNPALTRSWINHFNTTPPNALYISHIHQDHCDLNTLNQFTFKCPIYIANFQDKALLHILKNAGWPVIEYAIANLEPHIEVMKANGLELDSFALFKDPSGIKILNMNDCVYDDVEDQLGLLDIDLACLPYSGASCFPQCFDNLTDKEKLKAKKEVIKKYLDMFERYREVVDSTSVLPFAGQYELANQDLNKFLALPAPPTGEGILEPLEGKEFYIGMNKLIGKANEKFRSHYKGSTGLSIHTEDYRYALTDTNSPTRLIVKLPTALLWEVLTKRKHWNNLELASMLRYERHGDYDRELHYYLSYLHI